MEPVLDFERPIATLEKKLQDLRDLSKQEGLDLSSEIQSLEKKIATLTDEIFKNLNSWQKVLLSRHPNRPHTCDYIEALFPNFLELHGDRNFGDDGALVAGIATWPPQKPGQKGSNGLSKDSILILGHQKGRSTKQKMHRNFGMAKPEGYRKGMRLMEMAQRFKLPILTFIDTPGAYPGIETEERGQAQAIAESMRLMFSLDVPIITVVIGEGGSGGALAIGVANKVLMMEFSTYSVISPEGCASILWSDSKLAERASECLRMSPTDLEKLGVIDGIISEPKGGAHRDWNEAFENMRQSLVKHFTPLVEAKPKKASASAPAKKTTTKTKSKSLVEGQSANRIDRFEKFRKMGMKAIAHTESSSS